MEVLNGYRKKIDASTDPVLINDHENDLRRLEALLNDEETKAQESLSLALEEQLGHELARLKRRQAAERDAAKLDERQQRKLDDVAKQHERAQKQLEADRRP